MGFQRVDIFLRNGERVRNVLVHNAQLVEWPNEKRAINCSDIAEIKLSRNHSSRLRPSVG